MTRLTISEDPGEEFAVRGHNTATDADEDIVVFYNDVTKVHVAPEQDSFTIQVLTPKVVIEMDFAGVDKIHESLSLFEAKKVLAVDFDSPNSVRIMPPTPGANRGISATSLLISRQFGRLSRFSPLHPDWA